MPTEAQAKTMQCPMRRNRACIGSNCMAWRWAAKDRLTIYIAPIEMPPKLNNEDFKKPHGANWKLHDVSYDHNRGKWIAEWRRDTDPERTGKCGLVQDDMKFIEYLLERIANELGDVVNYYAQK